MIVRVFDSAVDPADVEEGKEIFRTEVRPVFEGLEGCHGIELQLSLEERSGDLVEIAVVSRWESMEQLEAALATPEYEEALRRWSKLLQKTPLVRHFETVD